MNENGQNGMGAGPLSGLGDIAPESVDPTERLFRITRGQTSLPRRGWIVQPQWTPQPIPGVEDLQKLLEGHSLPRQWQMFQDLFVMLQRGRYLVKSPNWIEPPITAEMEDLASETAVALVNGAAVTVITYTVPDRCVAAFQTFGHLLTDASQWGTVSWSILVNNRPVRTYQAFLQQRGSFVQPTKFPKPITLKGKDVIVVQATGGAAAVSALARMQGFVIPVETVTQDGSYKDWNSR